MDERIAQQVRERARDGCEYCHMPQAFYSPRFQIDHIISRQHGGSEALDNLALCCSHCNRYKGPNIAAIDPLTGQMVRLFNPRSDDWREHFEWQGAVLVGTTAIGRATERTLNINHPDYVAVRESLVIEGVFPP